MLLSQVIVAAASLASFAHALPSSAPAPEGLVVLEQFTKQDGALTITVYGDASPSSPAQRAALAAAGADEPSELQRRCGSNSVVCDNAHLADRNACQNLINAVSGDNAQLPGSPRSICGTYSGHQCCISWHNPVTGAVRASLGDAARKVLDSCRGSTGVSGKTSDTLIGQTCTQQCLSDRATGC